MNTIRTPGAPRTSVAIALGAMAVALSAASLVVAVVALSRSGAQATGAGQLSSATPAAQNAAGGEPPINSAEPGSTETIEPIGDYTRVYQDERMRAESPGCVDNGNFMIGIDFDEPRVGSGGIDAYYSGCGPGTIKSQLRQAEISGPDATPEECLERIRKQPAHSPVAAAKGLTLCFETDSGLAESEATTQKVVFMRVTGVSSVNNRGILTFTLTAWKVP